MVGANEQGILMNLLLELDGLSPVSDYKASKKLGIKVVPRHFRPYENDRFFQFRRDFYGIK